MWCVCWSSYMHIYVFIHHSSAKGASAEDKDGTRQALSSVGTFMDVNADGNVVTDLFKCSDIWVCY